MMNPADLAYAYGRPPAGGRVRCLQEDFLVSETLGFEPDGDGEHVLLYVRKRGLNTVWVGEQLAGFAGLPARAVGFAGLKDRRAVAEQWFSLHLPRGEPDWSACRGDGFEVLRAQRHRRKLRRGSHRGNRFVITVRDIDRPQTLEPRLAAAATRGVPNYFGPQRFGRDGANLRRAAVWFAAGQPRRGRGAPSATRRGLYLSAARAALFNRLLSLRVAAGRWDRLLPGEAVLLAGSRSWFVAERAEGELARRLADFDIHPSGPLWGRGEPPSGTDALALENTLLDDAETAALAAGLAAAGLEQERRALRLRPERFESDLDGGRLVLRFWLPRGAYATALLRELIDERTPSPDPVSAAA